MVALARFVVVAKQAQAIADEGKTVLEAMAGAAHWTRDPPNHDFDERVVAKYMTLVDQQLRPHVGAINNASGMLSISPTLLSWARAIDVKALASRRLKR